MSDAEQPGAMEPDADREKSGNELLRVDSATDPLLRHNHSRTTVDRAGQRDGRLPRFCLNNAKAKGPELRPARRSVSLVKKPLLPAEAPSAVAASTDESPSAATAAACVSLMAPPSRKQSIAESVEKTFDKNTVILIVNLLILVLLMSLLYVVASSALGAQYAQPQAPATYHKDEN